MKIVLAEFEIEKVYNEYDSYNGAIKIFNLLDIKSHEVSQEVYNQLTLSIKSLNRNKTHTQYKMMIVEADNLNPLSILKEAEDLEKEIKAKLKRAEAKKQKAKATRQRNLEKKKRDQLEKLKKELGEE